MGSSVETERAARAPTPSTDAAPARFWSPWRTSLLVLGVATAILTTWAIWSGPRSDYYAAVVLSMSRTWSNFFFGAFDPAGTITLDKIPGSFWIPALFVKVFGFSTWAIILPNAIAAVLATVLVAVTVKRVLSPTAAILAGAIMATTPILIAVARTNQAESFFLLGLALTAWAATKALQRASLGWLLASGLFLALSFQAYMLEAWALWPALAAGYLCTAQPMLRKIWHVAVAGVVSLGASLGWIAIVALVPADNRPYVGSTVNNSPWEMVFGYNGLGRFTATSDTAAYRSFTPRFSGPAGVFRLFNPQLAGQVGWLIPTALLALVVLWVLRFDRAITVLLSVWLLTFLAMFSAVAGMHQFYTSSLAIPIAFAVSLAIGAARRRHLLWPQIALVAVAVTTALVLGFRYGGYSIPVSLAQTVVGIAAIALLVGQRFRLRRAAGLGAAAGVAPSAARRTMRRVTIPLLIASIVLTPAAWSVATLGYTNAINPVAGGRPEGGGGSGSHVPAVLSYLERHRDGSSYLVATFGTPSAAPLITASGGDRVLPIGGFLGGDATPTRARFTHLVATGQLRFVLGADGPDRRGSRGGATPTASSEIRRWVQANCVAVPEESAVGLYQCAPAQ